MLDHHIGPIVPLRKCYGFFLSDFFYFINFRLNTFNSSYFTGTKITVGVMQFLKSCKYESSYLWTTKELHAAAALYRNAGFRLTEEKESQAFGKKLVEQRYDLVKA